MGKSGYDIAIAGGGAIGLSIGWRLAQDGANVIIIDSGATGQEASSASGGMLGAAAEVGFEDLELKVLELDQRRIARVHVRVVPRPGSVGETP